jgi:hypothetical protein
MDREAKKKIVEYVLIDVLEVSDKMADVLINTLKYDTIKKLCRATERTLQSHVEEKLITAQEIDLLNVFRRWYSERRKKSMSDPTSLEEWKNSLTADNVDESEYSYIPEKVSSPAETSKTDTFDQISVKIIDFPLFSGKTEHWNIFKQTFEATCDLSPYDGLLHVTDVNEHLKRREVDPPYDRIVRGFYSILQRCTACGYAISKVTCHRDTKDGVLVWNNLKKYYDNEGDDVSYGTKVLQELIHLKLEPSTPGDMDRYVSMHQQLVQSLVNAHQPLSELQKKTIFLDGIQDEEYTAKKDLCSRFSYDETVLEMRYKAVQIGKASVANAFRKTRLHQLSNTKLSTDPSTHKTLILPSHVCGTSYHANKKRYGVKYAIKRTIQRMIMEIYLKKYSTPCLQRAKACGIM